MIMYKVTRVAFPRQDRTVPVILPSRNILTISARSATVAAI